MRFRPAIRFVALLSTGLLAGILFGDRMGASFVRPTLPSSCFVQFQQGLHGHFVPMLPFLMSIAILASLKWLILARSRSKGVGLALLGLATLGLASAFVLTLTVNVPINQQLMTWSPAAPPPDVMEIWRTWERAHTGRTVLIGVRSRAVGSGRAPRSRWGADEEPMRSR